MSWDFRSSRLAVQLIPFAAATFLAWVAVIVGSTIDWFQYGLATALLFVSAALAVLRVPGRRTAWLGVVPSSLVYLLAVAVLRSSAGGFTSGVGILALVPVLYTALYGRTRRDLLIVIGGVGLFFLAPILLFGAPKYPDSQYRSALLSVAVSSIVGLATQGLVADVRQKAGEARTRERMLEQVSLAVHSLFDSTNVRADVCRAALDIGNATGAVLYEPTADSERLTCTATSGIPAPDGELPAASTGVVYEVFEHGNAKLTTHEVESQVASTELWIAAGRPGSVLYQPLRRGKVSVGVLAVGWPDQVRVEGPRATVVALLAHEAAALIGRADAMDNLNDAAQTDPLTGLPNRRAWDAGLQRAMSEHKQLVVAILDFDHFKQFNDTNGHPAGDRLLKETAVAWRDELRTGDFLARIGGEEFGVLLDCDLDDAADVVERLRARVVEGRTCSAGIAMRRVGENLEGVVARADHALYEAKSQGRNRACMSTAGNGVHGLSLVVDEPAPPVDDSAAPGGRRAHATHGSAGRFERPPDDVA